MSACSHCIIAFLSNFSFCDGNPHKHEPHLQCPKRSQVTEDVRWKIIQFVKWHQPVEENYNKTYVKSKFPQWHNHYDNITILMKIVVGITYRHVQVSFKFCPLVSVILLTDSFPYSI